MGCGASTVLEQTPRQPSNVEKMQENHVAKTPLEQPIQQSEPRNAIPKLTATKVEPEPVQQEPVKAAPSEPEHQQPESVEKSLGSDKTAPTYTEDSLQEILELEKKLSSVESNGFVGQYQTQHKLLVNCYTALQAAQKKVDDLKQQTYVNCLPKSLSVLSLIPSPFSHFTFFCYHCNSPMPAYIFLSPLAIHFILLFTFPLSHLLVSLLFISLSPLSLSHPSDPHLCVFSIFLPLSLHYCHPIYLPLHCLFQNLMYLAIVFLVLFLFIPNQQSIYAFLHCLPLYQQCVLSSIDLLF